jgi:MFS family permease
VFRALRHRNYRLFFAGQTVSLLGMWLQAVALAWLIYRLTGSSFAVGLVTLAQQGPGLFIGPVAGALADRHSRRAILVSVHTVMIVPSLLLGALTLSGQVEAWQVVALALVMGVCRGFEIPARQSFIPALVDRDDLPNAVALNSALFNSARLVGPAIAGPVIAWFGEGWLFLVNGVSFVPIIGALLLMQLVPRIVRSRDGTSLVAEIREGLRYVRGEPIAWALLGGIACASLFGMPYSVLLPSFVDRVLQEGPATFGYMNSAIAVGAITSALVLATRRGIEGLDRWIVAAGIAFGLALVLFSRANGVVLAFALLPLVGAAFMMMMAGTNTLLQLTVPDELRGRVMSLHSALFLGVLPFGGLIAGALADRVGEPTVLAFGGLAAAVSAIGFGRVLLRRSRELSASVETALPD